MCDSEWDSHFETIHQTTSVPLLLNQQNMFISPKWQKYNIMKKINNIPAVGNLYNSFTVSFVDIVHAAN